MPYASPQRCPPNRGKAKYGKPFQETKVDMSPEELHSLVTHGKLEVEANWKVGESGNSTITCKLSRHNNNLVIRLTYLDTTESAKLRDNELRDKEFRDKESKDL